MHIAMWSGPRNLSTAMMYSFGARADFDVVDEPFYGAYLKLSGADHPLRQETMASMSCDPKQVAAHMTQAPAQFFYSKQMTHHMVPGIPRDWFEHVTHTFLIRHPVRVVASYAQKREKPTVEDVGFLQQIEIFEQVRSLGRPPVVIDSFDIREDPARMMRKLCGALNVPWDPQMLQWPKGGHKADGIWARHWYNAVHNSTSFAAPEPDLPQLEPDLQQIADAAMPSYEAMAAWKI